MLKRILALALCLVLLVAALPINASAASEAEKERICQQIRDVYWMSLSSAGLSSFHGYCGTMAGWELYHLGITEVAITQNGNEMYNMLKATEHLCEGISPEYYPASMYSIEEALNTITNNGQKDVYNIMVGFDWTSTAAGSIYGHVNVIHAVLDGMVYFTEGFTTPFQTEPSEPMICTISEYADYFNKWTSFEGMIYFGRPNSVDGCATYGSDMFVTVNADTELLRSPDKLNPEVERTVIAGERLYVTAVCVNEFEEHYYQVEEDDVFFYIPADMATPMLFLYDDLIYSDIVLPEHVAEGKDFRLSGVIRSKQCKIINAVVTITDAEGNLVLSYEMLKDSYMLDLSTNSINARVDISLLTEGAYSYEVYCDMVNYYDDHGLLIGDMQRVLVASSNFTVGDAEPVEIASAPVTRMMKDGWQYESGSWRYYENDVHRTGWFCDNGVNYYLQEDGSAATGWTEINGKLRCFTATGAMRTGWVETDEGTCYLMRNGALATGLYEVDGTEYLFDENGLLVQTPTI